MIYNRLRRIRDARRMLAEEGIDVTYYYIMKLYIEGIVKGCRFGKTVYINYDDLRKKIFVGGLNG